jgi:hypothetical protein
LGVPIEKRNARHPAGKWRYLLIDAVQHAGGDPDIHLPKWLSEGSPMAFELPIEPGVYSL